MSKFFRKVHAILADSVLRNRILFVLFGLAIFRVMASIPLPSINPEAVQKAVSNSQGLQLFTLFSGAGLSSYSIVMLGVGPYITASIIMQLMTVLSPKIKSMYHEEGEIGRKKFSQISRLVTVPLAFLQAWGLLVLFKSNDAAVFPMDMLPITFFLNILVAVAGSMILMFLGELMTEKGIGNGTSLIIFSGIVSRLLSDLAQLRENYDPTQIPTYVGAAIAIVVVIAGIIAFTEAERPVPIAYAKSVAGGRQIGSGIATYLPLRVNQAGVIPIVFAMSMFLFPQLIGGFLQGLAAYPQLVSAGEWIVTNLTNGGTIYSFLYFGLVVFFTFFYTAITFEPETVAKNLQQSGAFIPGIRPGVATAEHLAKVVLRITFLGAMFLGVVAVLPFVMQVITKNSALAIGGTAVLIAVSVVTDIIKKLDAQLSMREY
jgi:preprotein translocase subunit SecY